MSDQRRRKHKSTNTPADSVRRAPWNNVMEARKVDRVAIGGWFTLCLLRANIGSCDEARKGQKCQNRKCKMHVSLLERSKF